MSSIHYNHRVTTSLFDLYKIGVGPSSSHTMGPMRAAHRFARALNDSGMLASVARIRAELYGSLALTGVGHGTDRAVLLGLSGHEPATVDPAAIDEVVATVRATHALSLAATRTIGFEEATDLLFHRDQMFPPSAITHHPNGMRITAFDANETELSQQTYFSIGGGFIVEDGETSIASSTQGAPLPYPFQSAAELLELASANNLSIDELMLANECARLPSDLNPDARRQKTRQAILSIWQVMQGCVTRGIATEGTLPGGLNVRRRAHRPRCSPGRAQPNQSTHRSARAA